MRMSGTLLVEQLRQFLQDLGRRTRSIDDKLERSLRGEETPGAELVLQECAAMRAIHGKRPGNQLVSSL